MDDDPVDEIITIEKIQEQNLSLLERLRAPEMNYGENPNNSGGRYLVDIFSEGDIQSVVQETAGILERAEAKEVLASVNAQVTLYPQEEISYVVFNQRVNLGQYPIPLEKYSGKPYVYTYGDKDPLLNQASAEFSNVPALVLGEALVDGEKWIYVRTNTVAGWIKNDERVVVPKKREEIFVDPLKPAENIERVRARGGRLGVVTAYGLTDKDGILVPLETIVDPSMNDAINAPDFSPEVYGDGIAEEAEEAAFMSMGNTVIIIAEDTETYTIELPNRETRKVQKENISIGYLPPTKENMQMLVEQSVGRPYSWGDGNGRDFDCSGFAKSLLSAFGILIPRGGDGQRYGIEGKEYVIATRATAEDDFRTFLPRTIQDLERRNITRDKIKWGFTLVSWGTHVMLLLDYDPVSGEIEYAHSVSAMKAMGDLYPPIPLWKVVKGPSSKRADEGPGESTNTFSPLLPLPTDQTTVRRNALHLVVTV